MILLTAATPWERRPLEKTGLEVLETGIGPAKAREALDAWRGRASVVVSSGFAGALQPGIFCGDILFDPLESPVALAQGARETAEELGIPLHMGRIQSVDRVLESPDDKRRLAAQVRAAAVDMETAAVRDWARSRGVTPLGVRVILDGLDDRLPRGLPKGDSLAAGVRYAFSRPAEIPFLIGLGLRQRRAIAVLVRFLEAYAPRIPSFLERSHAEEA
ncbi:MAG: hypothetical protein AUJ52_04015 [Elusimicrobia bacterium CG1_02_63_36]|nr:MAG: hypothetical protein AUJ52_04015 [Elusimicrobia bacterium CG1_02_63_36]PIP83266.1 MAG: hypothetical protein COR54_10475 [Elusimicrobia bacterium CG22_combo_CG10-13_8_21_14_all_63_91]PJA14922.1 MAG: hypothetical protein COX66_11295 [Elusimicrobia bacterium CG_4_10_14_0_2_um_filter_63_34]PJB26003.1 MAG: hypothetical protein CO113_05810 [Elusimicrobia bacterium CG_4_9_14_3_um_filter_62_55]